MRALSRENTNREARKEARIVSRRLPLVHLSARLEAVSPSAGAPTAGPFLANLAFGGGAFASAWSTAMARSTFALLMFSRFCCSEHREHEVPIGCPIDPAVGAAV